MAVKTVNNIIELFQSISDKHYQLNDFGFGNIFEINGELKPGLRYNLLWVVPLDSVTKVQTKERRFLVMVLGLVEADLSNRNEVWSDCERILDDIVKIFRYDSDDYNLLEDPVLTPVSEKHGDWVTGWQTELVIETDFNSNYCDIPASDLNFNEVGEEQYVLILNQSGTIIARRRPPETYSVIEVSAIDGGAANTTFTNSVIGS
jgi:hypothetical protein